MQFIFFQKKTSQYIGALIISSLLLISGCAPKLRIRASDTMMRKNPMKEIAIVADGRIERAVRSEIKGIQPHLDLTASKIALEKILPLIKIGLQKRGYEISFCEPIGIGFYSPHHSESWVVDHENDKKWQISDYEPVYIYPIAQNNQGFYEAVRNVFERAAQYERFKLNVEQYPVIIPSIGYVPKDIVQEIQKVTGGDTICFLRIYGQKVPGWEKTLDAVKDVLLAATVIGILGIGREKTKETVVAHFTCADAKDGEILLQYGVLEKENPINPGKNYYKKVLKYFPGINETLQGFVKIHAAK